MNVSRVLMLSLHYYITFILLITHSLKQVAVHGTLHGIKHERVSVNREVPARKLVLKVISWSPHSGLSSPHHNKNI